MAGAVIGALRVVIGADSAALDKGLKNAQGSLRSFATGAAQIAAGIGLEKIVERAASAFTHSIKQGFEAADKLGKSAQKIGVPVEELSKLGHAADLSGVSMESLEKGVGKLSQTIALAAGGGVSEATRAFAAMGISVKDADGNIRPTTNLIEDLAVKFETMKDGAGKTALAMQIFGKSGKDLIPLLNEGKDGLAVMFKEAEKLGLVISGKTVAATTHFNDDMRTLQKVGTGVSLMVTAELAPAFAVLVERMKKSVIEGDLVKKVAAGITDTIISTISIVSRLGLTFVRMSAEITGAVEAVKGFFTSNERMKAGWKTITDAGDTYRASVAGIDEEVKKFLADAAARALQWSGESKKRSEEAASGVEKHKNALTSFIDSQNKSLAAQAADTASVGAAIGQKERLRTVMQALAVADANKIALSPAVMAAITGIGNAAGTAAIQMAGMQMTQEQLEPWELYAQKLTHIQQLYDAGAISGETYGRAMKSAADSAGMSWQSFGGTLASTMGDASRFAASFAKDNKAMAVLSKAFGIGQTIINTQMAVMKALAFYGPTPWGYAAAGLAAASGAMAVATISAQKFATGGSFQIGGTGGVDSQLVPMMVTPGEKVNVEQNKYGDSDGESGRRTPVTIYVPAPTLDSVRSLLDQMRGVIRDGYSFDIKPA